MSRIIISPKKIVLLNTLDASEDFNIRLIEGIKGFFTTYSQDIYKNYQDTGKVQFKNLVIVDELLGKTLDERNSSEFYCGQLTEDDDRELDLQEFAIMMLEIEYAKSLVKAIDSDNNLLTAESEKDFSLAVQRAMKGVPTIKEIESYTPNDIVDFFGDKKFNDLLDDLFDRVAWICLSQSYEYMGFSLDYDKVEGFKIHKF